MNAGEAPSLGSYPFIALTFNKLYRSTKDVWRIVVDHKSHSWIFMKDLQLPCNPSELIDICAANLPLYRGLFFLWQGQRERHLDFVGLNPKASDPVPQNIELPLPPKARSLASFSNQGTYSNLLVVGQGLFHFTAADALDGGPYTILSQPEDQLFSGIQELAVGQVADLLSIWGLNEQRALVYQQFSCRSGSALEVESPAVPLLTKEEGSGRFATIYPKAGQIIYVAGQDDKLRKLEQNKITRV